MQTLKERLNNWTDPDSAAFSLAVCLGLIPDDDKLFRTEAKHLFWAAHRVGDQLYHFMYVLVSIGVLEENPTMQIRWNPKFKGSWE